ncbi:MAG: PASTA domain-containing protein [Nitrospirota bacterium]
MPVTVKKFFQILLIVLVFLGLAMASAIITMNAFTWGHTVTVPDVRGKELTAAINQIRNSGLDIKVEREEHHPTVPQNYIIGQNPAPGDRVKSGRNVMVIVSLGSEEVAVPTVADKVFRLAQVTLKEAGLELGEVARVNSQSPAEMVILQSPAQGTVLQKGSEVDMLVSAGGRATRYVTPDLTGMTLPQAGDLVRPMGGKVFYSGRGNVIASQGPRAGYQLPANGQIIVALGEPAPPKQDISPVSQQAKKSKTPGPKPPNQDIPPVSRQAEKSKAPGLKPPKQDKTAAAQPSKTNQLLNPMGH